MVVKSARRYITALDKILKSQHNDITTKIVEFNDDNIEFITLNFFIDSKQCFVAAYDHDDIVEYHVDGIDGVIEYKIGDNETHKHSIYTILNRIYDLIVKLEEENNKTSEESIKDTIIADDNIAYQNARVKETKHSVLEVMQCMRCPADREGNRCGGKQWCKQTWKRYDAIVNPEWHRVSMATLANIDNDMLDEKRQRYFKIYKELIKTVSDLHKCKTVATYQIRWWKFKQVIADDIYYRGTTLYMIRFLDAKISMCNVECGLWASANEKATSFIKSRRYGQTTLK